MFTGIIEEVGRLKSLMRGVIEIECRVVLDGLKVGDSISVNGICLTATAFDDKIFRADVMPETIRRTSLDGLKVGSKINLERALRLGDRLGGHIVSGHIDGVGKILSIRAEGNARVVTVGAERSILRQIVEKGSVALDGISLTMVGGDVLNIETDLIGKYIERQMHFDGSTDITKEFLISSGF